MMLIIAKCQGPAPLGVGTTTAILPATNNNSPARTERSLLNVKQKKHVWNMILETMEIDSVNNVQMVISLKMVIVKNVVIIVNNVQELVNVQNV